MAEYLIDGQFREIEIKGNFDFGKSEFLSTPENDLCHKQSWYESGYAVFNLFSKTEFDDLKKGIQECLFKISKNSKDY